MSRMYGPVFRTTVFPIIQVLKRRPTFEHLRHLESCAQLSREALNELQWEKVKATVALSKHVPLYRRKYSTNGMSLDDIRSWQDFSELPLLTRDEVSQAGRDLVADNYSGPLSEVRTSGSSGQPLAYRRGAEWIAANVAARSRARQWHGICIGDPYIYYVTAGHLVESDFATVWNWIVSMQDKVKNRLMLPTHKMSEEDLAVFVERMLSFKPLWGSGFPSCFHRLAAYSKEHRISWPFSMKRIEFTGENCYGFQRRLVEEVFHCPTTLEYGANEVGIVAYECLQGRLHVMDENIHLEIIPRKGLPAGTGEIVITQLHNMATPLIRYQTGDVGALATDLCTCGSNLAVLEQLMGRELDLLVTQDGRYIHGEVFMKIFKRMQNVHEFRVVQRAGGSFDIAIVPQDAGKPIDTRFLWQKMREQFGDNIKMDVHTVDSIPSDSSGKRYYIRSEIAHRTRV